MKERLINRIKPGLVVLVTAGASGIGRVISETFLAHGCSVHICDIDQLAIDDFLHDNSNATATVADVSAVADVSRLFEELLRHYGRLDVLINNAGIAGPTVPAEEVKPQDWEKTIAVNLSGQFYCCQKAIPMLKDAGGGSIINLASSAGLFGCPNRAPYAASKWAVIGLTKTLAMELGPFNIRVNAISPGSVEGPRIEAVIASDASEWSVDAETIRKLYTSQISLKRFIQPQEVANLALFLASDLALGISGQSLNVDGNTESLSNIIP